MRGDGDCAAASTDGWGRNSFSSGDVCSAGDAGGVLHGARDLSAERVLVDGRGAAGNGGGVDAVAQEAAMVVCDCCGGGDGSAVGSGDHNCHEECAADGCVSV